MASDRPYGFSKAHKRQFFVLDPPREDLQGFTVLGGTPVALSGSRVPVWGLGVLF